jgi:hypothetical protein
MVFLYVIGYTEYFLLKIRYLYKKKYDKNSDN